MTRAQSFPYDQNSAFVRACILLVLEKSVNAMFRCLFDGEESCLLVFLSGGGGVVWIRWEERETREGGSGSGGDGCWREERKKRKKSKKKGGDEKEKRKKIQPQNQ